MAGTRSPATPKAVQCLPPLQIAIFTESPTQVRKPKALLPPGRIQVPSSCSWSALRPRPWLPVPLHLTGHRQDG